MVWRVGNQEIASTTDLREIPKFIAWLIIVGQSFGSIALVAGFLGRIAAGGLFIIFTGALIVHLPCRRPTRIKSRPNNFSAAGGRYCLGLLRTLFVPFVAGLG